MRRDPCGRRSIRAAEARCPVAPGVFLSERRLLEPLDALGVVPVLLRDGGLRVALAREPLVRGRLPVVQGGIPIVLLGLLSAAVRLLALGLRALPPSGSACLHTAAMSSIGDPLPGLLVVRLAGRLAGRQGPALGCPVLVCRGLGRVIASRAREVGALLLRFDLFRAPPTGGLPGAALSRASILVLRLPHRPLCALGLGLHVAYGLGHSGAHVLSGHGSSFRMSAAG